MCRKEVHLKSKVLCQVSDLILHNNARAPSESRQQQKKRTKNVQNADFCMVVRLSSAESLALRKMQMRCSAQSLL